MANLTAAAVSGAKREEFITGWGSKNRGEEEKGGGSIVEKSGEGATDEILAGPK